MSARRTGWDQAWRVGQAVERSQAVGPMAKCGAERRVEEAEERRRGRRTASDTQPLVGFDWPPSVYEWRWRKIAAAYGDLAGRVARHRVEVGADHRGVRVHVAEPRQPLVAGPAQFGRLTRWL